MGHVDIPDDDGAIVISIETARRWRRREAECEHHRVEVDPEYSEIACRDCARRLNPIEWLARMADRWSNVQRLYRTAREEQARLALRKRVKCDHCGKFARVVSNDADEKRRQESEAARYRAALERIVGFEGQGIGERAVRVAREALAEPGPLARPPEARPPEGS